MNQDQEANETPSIPCSQGCGFFGCASTNNMCSKCFKEQQTMDSKQVSSGPSSSVQEASMLVKPLARVLVEEVKPSPVVYEPTVSAEQSPKRARLESSADRTRCAECKKKVGLTAVECRCGQVYCSAHRMAERHMCSFDYKAHGRLSLEKANERVVAESLSEKL
jgi:hypothetical protein